MNDHLRFDHGQEVPAQPAPRHDASSNSLRLAVLATLGSVASGLAIVVSQVGGDGVTAAATLVLGLSLPFWLGLLVVSGFGLLGRLADRLQFSPWRGMPPESEGGGLSDGWLDGPI